MGGTGGWADGRTDGKTNGKTGGTTDGRPPDPLPALRGRNCSWPVRERILEMRGKDRREEFSKEKKFLKKNYGGYRRAFQKYINKSHLNLRFFSSIREKHILKQ